MLLYAVMDVNKREPIFVCKEMKEAQEFITIHRFHNEPTNYLTYSVESSLEDNSPWRTNDGV